MEKLILAIDQGTTSTTALLLNSRLEVVGRASQEILPSFPQYGWVEHDLDKIWEGTSATLRTLFSQHSPGQVVAIGITNQRETVGAWNRVTGNPYHKAIVWQCRRTTARCEKIKKNKKLDAYIRKSTGLVTDPYFSGSKIEWLLQNVPGLRGLAQGGEAVFGTIDSYLLHRLTDGVVHGTDVSNASRTLLMNIQSLSWDKKLLSTFSVPEKSLPKIFPSAGIFGHTKNLGFLPDGIPISGILGDQQAALFGQLCLSPGEAKCTYGTGAFLMCNTGKKIVRSKHGLLSTVAWQMNGQTTYALEGSAFVAGAAVQFLRDNLGIIQKSSEIEGLAKEAKAEEMGDLVFVPCLTGLGAPYWEPAATGMIHGLTRGTSKAHIARAALEGIAFQNDDLLTAFASDIKPARLKNLRVDGGASANNFLVQLQADLAGIKIQRPKILETTALGSALAAGLAVGVWKNAGELKNAWGLEREFSPQMKGGEKKKMQKKWQAAIRRVRLKPKD